MRSKSVRPSHYPPVPFHTIRFIALLSAVVVAIVVAVFIYSLQQKGYKLPWAFLILIISALLSITNITLTTAIHCFYGLSPRLSLTFNGLLLILWSVSLGLLSWGMRHTLLTSCTKQYWGTTTGINVCRAYKALFTFTATATASAIMAVWLDVIVRKRQTRFGEYNPMGSNTALNDVKLQDRNSAMSSGALRHGEDAFNDVSDPDPIYGTHHRDGSHGGDDGYHYGEESGRTQRGGYGAGGYGYGHTAYSGYSHVPETGYDAGSYR